MYQLSIHACTSSPPVFNSHQQFWIFAKLLQIKAAASRLSKTKNLNCPWTQMITRLFAHHLNWLTNYLLVVIVSDTLIIHTWAMILNILVLIILNSMTIYLHITSVETDMNYTTWQAKTINNFISSYQQPTETQTKQYQDVWTYLIEIYLTFVDLFVTF